MIKVIRYKNSKNKIKNLYILEVSLCLPSRHEIVRPWVPALSQVKDLQIFYVFFYVKHYLWKNKITKNCLRKTNT